MGWDGCSSIENRQKESLKTTVGTNENGSFTKQSQWNCSTKSMELFNEINGIVERNQWIRLQKLAVLLSETDNLAAANCQNACGATRICMNTHVIFQK